MLREGRSLSELVTIAERVYGPPANVNAKSANVLAVLGTIRRRPWGDEKRAEEILRVTAEVIGGAK